MIYIKSSTSGVTMLARDQPNNKPAGAGRDHNLGQPVAVISGLPPGQPAGNNDISPMGAPIPPRQYQLKTFMHRVLALRPVALVFGAITYARGYERN